jgi:endonuclease/exonuclease/phosphatase family metal-dependent hydrolase
MSWTLATYNVMNLLEPREPCEPRDQAREQLRRKIEAIGAMLRECDADVVALQEIGSAALVSAVVAAVPGAGYAEPIVGTADARGIRCAIVTRLPLLAARVHTAEALAFPAFVATDPSPFGARIPLRRGVVHAVVDAPGTGAVHVFSAHFKSRIGVPLLDAAGREVPPTSARARSEAALRSLVWRAAEALFVRALVDDALASGTSTTSTTSTTSATAPPASAIVAGDLNDLPGSPVLAALRGEGPGELFDCTSRIPSEARYSLFVEGRGVQIDHVLATAGLYGRLAGARFANAGLRDHGPFVPGVPEELSVDSDHAPLVVTFA